MENSKSRLISTVIEGGYCIGCGACAIIENSPFQIKLDNYQKYTAFQCSSNISEEQDALLQEVCPFSQNCINEDEIGKDLFGNFSEWDSNIGYHVSTYAGHVIEGDYRENGSSGGMITWLLSYLLRENQIDGVIHVKPRLPTSTDKRLFHYDISRTIDEIKLGAKSRYYPIELSEVLKRVKEQPGRYAVVGLPCFIKSIRLLSRNDQLLKNNIKYCIGLVCGHLKSGNFANNFAMQYNIHPSELLSIDFRLKLKDYPANRYGVLLQGTKNGQAFSIATPPSNDLYGTNWGLGLFKYKACDYCDDVVAETADITFGDAWLPKYNNDYRGKNLIIIRNRTLESLFLKAIDDNLISVENISIKEVVKSQNSGFNHRRKALAFRLFLADKEKSWRPRKRVKPELKLKKNIQQRQILRMEISNTSHSAFFDSLQKDDFEVFKNQMDPLIKKYNELYRVPTWRILLSKVYRTIFKRTI